VVNVKLEEYPEIKKWISSYRSQTTRKNYLVGLSILLKELRITPRELLDMHPVELREKAWEIIKKLIAQEKYQYANFLKYSLKSFYNFFKEEEVFKWKKRVHRVPRPIKYKHRKHIPTHEEVWSLIDSATLKTQAMISLMYSCGLGPDALTRLKYGHVKHLLQAEDYPVEITIDETIYPKRFVGTFNVNFYKVLIDRDHVAIIKRYLEEYHKDSTDDTPLFYTREDKNKPIRANSVYRAIKRAMRKNPLLRDVEVYPYLLRDSYYNRLVEGGMSDIHREYLMGHNLGIRQHYYDIYREEIKEQYKQCNFNRGTKINREVEKLKKELEEERKKRLELEARVMRESSNIRDLVYRYLKETIPPEIYDLVARKKQYIRKIITEEELEEYLNSNWEIEHTLNNGKIVVRKEKEDRGHHKHDFKII